MRGGGGADDLIEGLASPTVRPRDSQTLRKFKMHMRESYQFLPKKLLSQLYGDIDIPDTKLKEKEKSEEKKKARLPSNESAQESPATKTLTLLEAVPDAGVTAL